MATNYTTLHALSPSDVNKYDTERLRDEFLIQELFTIDDINLVYTHYDRLILGGVMPVKKSVSLEPIDPLKSTHFLDRRELGIINIGKKGAINVDGNKHLLDYKEALYIGKGAKEIVFERIGNEQPIFYLNSAPAHQIHPVKKITRDESEVIELGSFQTSNHRTVRKLIVHGLVKTCQLQMGMTELAEGSVWNTMPPHVHNRRMEAYLYFELNEDQVVSHFLGEPQNTRHIWLRNLQAVLSPPWSIHAGAGSASYTFIWGMAGENLDYSDMDICKLSDLK